MFEKFLKSSSKIKRTQHDNLIMGCVSSEINSKESSNGSSTNNLESRLEEIFPPIDTSYHDDIFQDLIIQSKINPKDSSIYDLESKLEEMFPSTDADDIFQDLYDEVVKLRKKKIHRIIQ